MWFLNQLAPESAVYNMLFSARIVSEVDIPALRRAFGILADRHPILRTSYRIYDRKPVQEIHDKQEINFDETDASTWSEEQLNQCLIKVIQRPFNLEKESVLRVHLFTRSSRDSIFVLIIHHIAVDVWARELILDELSLLYGIETGKIEASVPPLPEKQYTDFINWQTEMLASPKGEHHWQYWQKQLAGDLPVINLPIDKPRPPVQTYNGAYYCLNLSQELLEDLKTLAKAEGATLYTVLLAAFFVLLYRYTKQEDIVIGSLANGRTKNELLSIVGDIANFIVMRADLTENPPFKTFLTQVRHKVMGALLHQDYPFTHLVEQLVKERDPSRSPIYQVLFNMPQANTPGAKERLVFNLPEKKDTMIDFGGIKLEPFPLKQNLAGALDLGVKIWEIDGSLLCIWGYNTDLFEASTIADIAKNYQTLLEGIVANPDRQVSRLPLLTEVNPAKAKSEKPAIAIASTFTSQPVEESLTFWLQQLGLDYKIEFAPYNQIFQQLLDPDSLFSQNQQGINIILIRFEDWQKSVTGSSNEQIERNIQDLLLALQSGVQRSATPYLVCLCPPSPATIADVQGAALFQKMESQIAALVKNINNVYLVKYSELTSLYPVTNYYDAYGEENGHIPYTPTLYSALGTIIARKLHAIKRPPYKVIVLDCDQTLWKGVCAEDGVIGIEIDPPHRALQEFIVAQQEAGMLICLCSKNNEEDVFAVFDRHQSMPLTRHHLVSWRINWEPKSENLKSLAEELNLGLDSFIFIDDNPVECAEVRANSPQVLTLTLPQNYKQIPQFIQHIWAFDRLKVTQEDRERTAFYKQNIQRQQWQDETLTFADFLAGLNLEVKISPIATHQLARVSQLTQRTNQFNLTTIKRSEGDIQNIYESGELEYRVVEVKDRFGDYGLVGLMMFQAGIEAINVDTFLLSCRSLGRGVEYQMLAHLGSLAKERGLKGVDISYIPTEKNQPALDFLNSLGEKYKQQTSQGWLFSLPVDIVAQVKWEVRIIKEENLENSRENREYFHTAKFASYPDAIFERIATELYDPEQVLQVVVSQKQRERPELEKVFVAPRTPLEQILADIWAQVLGVEEVGIHDNFFELGGHSLLAVKLFAQIKHKLDKDLPLATLFQAPTIEELSAIISEKGWVTSWSSLVAVKPNGSQQPFFFHGGAADALTWARFAQLLGEDQPFYALQRPDLDGKEVRHNSVEELAAACLEEIRTIQPKGPYLLGGHCFGGTVVFEMAQQLHAQGEQVALLALFDAYPPRASQNKINRNSLSFRIQASFHKFDFWLYKTYYYHGLKLLKGGVKEKLDYIRQNIVAKIAAKQKQKIDVQQVDQSVNYESYSHQNSQDTLAHELRYLRAEKVNREAGNNYLPQVYSGTITILRAKKQFAEWYLGEFMGWDKLTSKGVEKYEISGLAGNLFNQTSAPLLADQLKLCLDGVEVDE